MSSVLKFDLYTTVLLQTIIPNNVFFSYFFSFFSIKGISVVIWLLIAAFLIFFEERKHPGIQKKDKQFLLCFTISLLITATLTNFVIKNIIRRPRPIFPPNIYHLTPNISSCPADFSFPSGHAASSFAAACILSYFDKKRRWFYYLVAILISYSRIYLGCHYFLDVVVGALIGYLVSKVFLQIHNIIGK